MVYFIPYNGMVFFMFKRNLFSRLLESMSTSFVVLLTGARQTGKTTLMERIVKEKGYTYSTFDDLRTLAAAKEDPIGFISDLKKPTILDEVQRVPEVFLPIKQDIDKHKKAGRYILTGSANPLLVPHLSDSLAGRMEILNLWPLSQGEFRGIKEKFIDRVFSDSFDNFPCESLDKQALIKTLIHGGYPAIHSLDSETKINSWCSSYLTTILQKDVQDLAKIEGLAHLPNLMSLLASRVSGLLNVAEISRTSGIPTTTLHRYLQLLQTLFLVILEPAWSANLSKRLSRSPKTYLIDTGLLAYLIGANQNRLTADTKLNGGFLENFVVGELNKQATWCDLRVRIFHYRTVQGNFEVDIVLEDASGHIVGIEVKSSETIHAGDFKGLKHLQEAVGNKFVRGLLLYPGPRLPFGKNLYALPISSLWAE